MKKDIHKECINSSFSSEISWLLGDLASGVDFEPKDPMFNPQTA
jgi:hypothetical protein